MEIAPSSRHMSGGGGDDDDNNNSNRRGKKPLLQQQKENQPSKVRKTKGRRRIKIRRIMSEHARLSTFSKRRSGVYKKANDIATQCGCRIGVVGITPAERAFSFGSPNIDTLIHRFLQQHYTGRPVPEKQGIDRLVDSIVEAQLRVRVDLLNVNHNLLVRQIGEERLKSQGLIQINCAFINGNPNDPYWWDLDKEVEMSDAQIEAAVQDIQNAIRIISDFRQFVLQQQYLMPLPPPPPPQQHVVEHYEGGSSGQPLQAAAPGMMMMDTVMEDPSSSSAAFVAAQATVMDDPYSFSSAFVATPAITVMEDPSSSYTPVAAPVATDNRDEEMDKNELMFQSFFGDYPSSPPGPF